jgi:hypothetical protein
MYIAFFSTNRSFEFKLSEFIWSVSTFSGGNGISGFRPNLGREKKSLDEGQWPPTRQQSVAWD